jgi:hypothetical protein
MFLPAGYVKLEGGTVNRENYPRLVALADTYSLWTDDPTANPGLFGEGDGSTTMVLPNWTGRMAQFAATAGGAVAAGLPNVTGTLKADSNGLGGVLISASGAFSTSNNREAHEAAVVTRTEARYWEGNFNASLSNPIYSASTTVQPPAINTFAIMRY